MRQPQRRVFSRDERTIVQWCQTNIGTDWEIRRECNLKHMKVKEVLEMCERLAKAGHIRGRDLPPGRYNLIGQYRSIKQLAYKRDAIN
jgi:hypothetical protein